MLITKEIFKEFINAIGKMANEKPDPNIRYNYRDQKVDHVLYNHPNLYTTDDIEFIYIYNEKGELTAINSDYIALFIERYKNGKVKSAYIESRYLTKDIPVNKNAIK